MTCILLRMSIGYLEPLDNFSIFQKRIQHLFNATVLALTLNHAYLYAVIIHDHCTPHNLTLHGKLLFFLNKNLRRYNYYSIRLLETKACLQYFSVNYTL